MELEGGVAPTAGQASLHGADDIKEISVAVTQQNQSNHRDLLAQGVSLTVSGTVVAGVMWHGLAGPKTCLLCVLSMGT